MPVGRPRVPDEKRPRAVLVRFPPAEYKRLIEAAAADSRQLAPFVRLLVLRQLESKP